MTGLRPVGCRHFVDFTGVPRFPSARRIAVYPQARTVLACRGDRICGIGFRGGDLTAVTDVRRRRGGWPRLGDDRLIAARPVGEENRSVMNE
jgi:hypothetical protein